MRASEWSRVSKPLAAALPGFEPFKRGFVRRHEWVAECIYADSSGFSRSAFYVEAFALPLFVPTDHLYFDYGSRVGGRWEGVTDDLVRSVVSVVPRLQERATLDGLVRAAQRPEDDIHHAEIHLCVALISDDQPRFHQLANEILDWEERAAWERPIIDRCSELAEAVRAVGVDSGLRILRERVRNVVSLFLPAP